jgi:hypothetical protein
MHPAIIGIALGTQLVVQASDHIPNFHVERTCKVLKENGPRSDQNYLDCLSEESWRNNGPLNLRNARQSGLFVTCGAVSRLPIWAISERNRRKSLANTWNIPVFGRPEPETVRDQPAWVGRSLIQPQGDEPDRPAPQGLEIPKNFICSLRRSSP